MEILMNGRETGQTGILLHAIVIAPSQYSIPLRERERERERGREIEYTVDN